MIEEQLLRGAENARTGRELAKILDLDIREVVRQVEKERRAGAPICAGALGTQGYYLAADQEELKTYCGRLFKRAGELHKTRRALLANLDKLPLKSEKAQTPTEQQEE